METGKQEAKYPLFMRPMDIAKETGYSTAHIYRLIKAGKFPGAQIGGRIRIPREAWEQWLSEQSRAALANVEQ